MEIPIVWKSYNPDSPSKGYWDMGLIEDLFKYKTGYTFTDYFDFGDLEGAVVVIPARSNVNYVNDINADLARLKWAVVMLTGDEDALFPYQKLDHPNMKLYVMSPREDLDPKHRVLGSGYPQHIHKYKPEMPTKELDWFFSGQVTHSRRQQCYDRLRRMDGGIVYGTPGFAQGLPADEYYDYMVKARVIPCPSGPATPDTFRLFESLEMGCIPIADTYTPHGGFTSNYWPFFFGENPPFPILTDYNDLKGYIQDVLENYQPKANRVFAWWQRKKQELARQIATDVQEVSGIEPHKETFTVVVPVSPIRSHPETHILEETLDSIRHHTQAEIIVTFDGVREEQESRRDDYEEFIRRMLWKFNTKYKNITPIIFDHHMHQTGMAKAVLDRITTRSILYVEQDTPLVTDYDIPLHDLEQHIASGRADSVRFHHEGVIPQEHNHMMLGMDGELMRTCQWSQRPHLASKAFYRRILTQHFSKDSKSFIEDKMHSVCHEAYLNDGEMGWSQYKLAIYHPDGNIKRSYHLDGRAGEFKYDSVQIF